ncbi:unnamed protein product (macronuclear) [Paramecium tetraurelia]|uniref:Myosin motor domain-containing protein n=1 Tax=Paramecium tetraurelia TaxID=5888 RepID=A0BVS3_PARTE|nr:uncharacterized protein GSPATT00032492001 [Paramecium tetraurelia]CAK62640.1 unnamed protein product [Paramecium tetraurelia]|eukprot:XP_001430038.1 hypothetical protein (macronuclear) [Paramecium tetraurelia strain d4-2]
MSQNPYSQALKYSMDQSFVPNVENKEVSITNIADIDHPDKIIPLLEQTFKSGQIYIDQGYSNLISLNPFQDTKHLSDSNIQNHKKDYLKLTNSQLSLSKPHLYKLAELAKQACFSSSNINNTCSILTQGISGSGKTVSAKGILHYVAALSSSGLFTSTTLNKVEIEQRIIASDIIFEAFGNAKTQKNSNSSRFGKVVSIQFENQKNPKNQKIISGKIVTTLFERTRLNQKGFMDRNFHIFYQLFEAFHKTEEIKNFAQQHEEDIEFKYDLDQLIKEIEKLALDTEFMLLGTQNQFMSSQDDQYGKQEEDQAQADEDFYKFMKLLQAFGDLDFTLEEVVSIFQCVAGLIHLKEDNYQKAEELLQIPNLKQTIDKNIETGQSRKLCAESIINGIIMDFYYKLFMWIQNRVNSNISQDFDPNKKYILNIFDSFGFEIFKNQEQVQQNLFEQLTLNYINEKLQNLFYQQIVDNAQKKFNSEGLTIIPPDFQKNDRIIFAIEDVIFKNLKDSNLLSRKTDYFKDAIRKSIPEKGVQDILIDESSLKKKQGSLTQSQITHKFQSNILGIRHTGGEIYYQLDCFLSSNKYMVSQEIQNINQLSQNQIIKSFTQQFQNQTVADTTQKEINDIIQTFKKSETWFVKCFQTNYDQKSGYFNVDEMKEQLSYSGLDQCANMLCQTYFLSIPKEEFFNTYIKLNPQSQNVGHLVDFINEQMRQSKEYTTIQPLQVGLNNILIKEQAKRKLDQEIQYIIHWESDQQYRTCSLQHDEQIEYLQQQLQKETQELLKSLEMKDEVIKGLNKKLKDKEDSEKKLIELIQASFKFNNELQKEFEKLTQNNNNHVTQLNQPIQNLQEQENYQGQ